MPITEMHIQGRNQSSAVLRRAPGAEFLEVEIATPGGTRKHRVQADDQGDLWSMAQCLQQTLDGFKGCGGDIRPYHLPLELMSDL